ncbi:FAD-dependent monooxygenase (plasmid) [Arthrobacter sp. zg-Y820]|uniref:FAD-dependent monooxygenase n=1 Tax=unclassified Arthrobacter TaxID=235627 RepID=UPI001E5BC61A|nr:MULTISPECIES: FAD-dependent monooxygenase [unclassified Arthrobacter]MCC9198504.1 FAD-dependent monooxygenase [Arthrobacter sp. zg-Y820]MDK1281374.1 FAD-dependent monooxygenase [Arthrobacter sp. zg.Y820]WIB11234.1 FAD-dependent monooxygenase [Arthrobacter sp. zg-Y820]
MKATNQDLPQAVVVGGGIGGFTAALALAQRGLQVQLLERAPAFKEIGAGLQVGPNAARVLKDLGVLDSVLQRAVLPRRFAILDIHSGNELYHATFGETLSKRYGAPYAVMHRHDLLTALMDAASSTGRVETIPGTEIVNLWQDENSVTVSSLDGRTYTADVLIGADGLRSVVRRHVLDDSEPLMSEYVIYRGPGPRPKGIEDAVTLYTGDEMHMMQYPMAGGEMVNRVVSFRSTEGAPGSETWGTREELLDRFSGACAHVRDSLQTLDLSQKGVQFDRKPMAGWTNGRVTLLGDAAHPMRQYLAQGAGQAMEDAVALADALADQPGNITGALQKYEKERYPRAAAVQMNTRFFGEMAHLGGVGAILRNSFFKKLPHDNFDLAEWLYGDGSVPPPLPPADVLDRLYAPLRQANPSPVTLSA